MTIGNQLFFKERCGQKMSFLMTACRQGNLEKVKNLIKSRKYTQSTIDQCLRDISETDNFSISKCLIEDGAADIHTYNEYPLRMASSWGNIKLVKYLVEKGADAKACDNDAIKSAICNSYFEIVKYLVDNGASVDKDCECLRLSLYSNNLKLVEYICEKGASKYIKDPDIIEHSLYGKNFKIFKYLIDHGANSYAALKRAILLGNFRVIKYLFTNKLININNKKDMIYIMKMALFHDRSEIILYLRKIFTKWKCNKCLVRVTCLNLCKDWYRK